MKTTTKTTNAITPNLAGLLGTMAYHLRSFHETPAGRTHRSGLTFGDITVMVTVEITASKCGNPGWDQCKVNGRGEGNRCGAEAAIAKAYAPVIAACAAAACAAVEQAA